MVILGFAALDFFLWVVPGIITLFYACFYTGGNVREDLIYNNCVTIGTVAKALAWLACAVLPVFGIVAALIFTMYTIGENEYRIRDFFDTPLCFWRKN